MPEAPDAAGPEVSEDQPEAQSAEAEPAGVAEPAVESPAEAPPHTSQQPVARPKPAPRASLPPFQPSLAAPGRAVGPPPGVLWLAGVIQGDRPVALLRRGKSRFLVREGDSFEDRYRVASISSNSVTLERGTRKQTLRVGEY